MKRILFGLLVGAGTSAAFAQTTVYNDLTAFKNAFGQQASITNFRTDANGDRVVNNLDFTNFKNNFGNTPCSLYGGDCGPDGNEDPKQERGPVCHNGAIHPPKGVPQELKPDSPRDSGYRVPRICVDLVGVRPVDLSIVDGIESIRGGEGAWNKGVKMVKPDLLLVGRNAVCVDTVCTAVMGHDPKADRGASPFLRGDNTLKLAEAVGIGTCDLARIEVAGLPIKEAVYSGYGAGATG